MPSKMGGIVNGEKLVTNTVQDRSQLLDSLAVFCGGLSHNLNNVLTSILGNIDIMILDMEDNQNISIYQDYLTTIRNSALLISNLTIQIMDYVKGLKSKEASNHLCNIGKLQSEPFHFSIRKCENIESFVTFSNILAHRFNNALMTILGNVEILCLEMKRNNDLSKYDFFVDEMKKVSLQAREITFQMLNLVKEHQPNKKTIKIVDLLKNHSKFFTSGKHITFEFEHEDNTPFISVDIDQLLQVYDNILINSIQAMPNGGKISTKVKIYEKIEVHFSTSLRGSFIEISVQDEGEGIPEENKESIFTPFFTTKCDGNGLGLAMCNQIVKNHGGLISFDSIPGNGTNFSIFLPIASNNNEVKTESVSSLNVIPIIPYTQGKILVMDDDLSIQSILKKILEKMNFIVETCSDGEEAIKILHAHSNHGTPFDAIILDLTIPGKMGGKEVNAIIKHDFPEIKSLITSGNSTNTVLSNYIDYGFAGVLHKPYTIQDLQNELQKLDLFRI